MMTLPTPATLRLAALLCLLPLGAMTAQAPEQPTGLLPWSEQIRIRESWLNARHAMLLPMMPRHGSGVGAEVTRHTRGRITDVALQVGPVRNLPLTAGR